MPDSWWGGSRHRSTLPRPHLWAMNNERAGMRRGRVEMNRPSLDQKHGARRGMRRSLQVWGEPARWLMAWAVLMASHSACLARGLTEPLTQKLDPRLVPVALAGDPQMVSVWV